MHAVDFARDPFEFVDRATSECGDIYRMDLPAVDDVFVLAHPDYFNRVLVADVDAFGKTEDYRRAFGNGLLSVEDQQWRRQREMMQPLFYREQIKGYTEQMVVCVLNDVLSSGRRATPGIWKRKCVISLLKFCSQPCSVVNWFLERIKSFAMPLMVSTSGLLPPRGFSPLASDTSRRRFDHSKERLRQEVRSLLAEEGSQSVSPSVADDGVAGGGQQRPEESSSNMDPSNLLTQLQRIRNSDDGEQLTTDEIEDQLITMVFAGPKRQLPHSRLRGTCWPRTRTSESGSMRNWRRYSVTTPNLRRSPRPRIHGEHHHRGTSAIPTDSHDPAPDEV